MRIRGPLYIICVALSFSLASQAFAGPPFKTDDPQPVDYHHWEFYVASMQQFQTHETGATCPHFEVNYGVVPNVQLHVVVPLEYVHTVKGTHYGYSDTELGTKYRFIQETETVPQVGVFPLIEIPTGNASEQLGAGKVQLYIPAWVQKTWGKLTTYAGGGYWYNPGTGGRNSLFTGWQAQYDFSEVVTLGGEALYQTADSQGSESSAGFNFGGFINVSENHHILFSLGRSFSGEATITGYLGYQLTI
ncbi:MAG: transporter [Bacteroidota bacterium]|jgi:hypothetical protein